MKNDYEIERKYIIKIPRECDMSQMPRYTRSDITQTYLKSEGGITHRVRRRKYGDTVVYTENTKQRISKMTVIEKEEEISYEKYCALAEEIDKNTSPLHKTRHTFFFSGHTLEIDVYLFWQQHAILEVELEDEKTVPELPEFINVVAEVTGDKAYSNHSMAHRPPCEPK